MHWRPVLYAVTLYLCSRAALLPCRVVCRCKFSHDLTVGRKAAKIDLYTDRRAEGEDKKDETNADWDQEKLEEVVSKKLAAEGTSGSSGPAAGAGAGVPTKTDIVCRYFLDAIEKEIYGWCVRGLLPGTRGLEGPLELSGRGPRAVAEGVSVFTPQACELERSQAGCLAWRSVWHTPHGCVCPWAEGQLQVALPCWHPV